MRLHPSRVRAVAAGYRPVRGAGGRRAACARDPRLEPRLEPVHDLRRRGRRFREGGEDRPPPVALAPHVRAGDRDGGRRRQLGAGDGEHDRVAERPRHEHERACVCGDAAGRHGTTEARAVPHRRQLRKQDHDREERLRRRSAGEAHRPAGEVHRRPSRARPGWRQHGERPSLRHRARRHRRRRVPVPEDRRRRGLRSVFQPRSRPPRERIVDPDRAVPNQQPAVRRQGCAHEQDEPDRDARRRERAGELHARASCRRGSSGARDRSRGVASAQSHSPRRIPLSHAAGQRLRQRRLRAGARHRPRRRPRAGLVCGAGGRAGAGPSHRNRHRQLPGADDVHRYELLAPVRRSTTCRPPVRPRLST